CSLGIIELDEDRQSTRCVEKPKEAATLEPLKLNRELYGELGIEGEEEYYLASMGIYVFNRDVLVELLDNTLTDFGRDVIPAAIANYRVFSYIFQGYWEDVGTIRSFFNANLDVTSELPRFNFFDMSAPVFSRPR